MNRTRILPAYLSAGAFAAACAETRRQVRNPK